MNFAEIANTENADEESTIDYSEFDAEQWQRAIEAKIREAAESGEAINTIEATHRLKKGK